MLATTPDTSCCDCRPRQAGDKHDNYEAGQLHAADQELQPVHSTSRISFRERLKHLTWAWFTLTMGTGGLALAIHNTPYQFRGLDIIGRVVYVLTLVFFVVLVIGITTRFVLTPSALRDSLTHPTESLFVPCSLISVASILAGAGGYGIPHAGPWLLDALCVCFWVYVAVSTVLAVGQFSVLFSGAHLPIHSMTPSWILPVFPAMLVGTIASAISAQLPAEHRMSILVAGVTYQGLGFMVALVMYPLYIGRMMEAGLPASSMRPGLYIPVGPPAYTTVAIIGMARAIPTDYGYFEANPLAPQVLRIMAVWVGIWTWCLAFWFFAISTVAVTAAVLKRQLHFSMVFYAMIFPNVGWVIATGYIGVELQSAGIKWVASGMTAGLAIVWCVIIYAHVVAIVRKEVLWPGRDEDSSK